MTPDKATLVRNFEIFEAENNAKAHEHAYALAISIIRKFPANLQNYRARDLMEDVCFQKTYLPQETVQSVINAVETTLMGQELYDPDLPVPDKFTPDEEVAPFWTDATHQEMCEYIDVIVDVAKKILKDNGIKVCVPYYSIIIDPDTHKFRGCPWHDTCDINECQFRRQANA